MSKEFSLNVTSRGNFGRGPSRRLRRLEGLLPGIIYGGAEAPQPIIITLKELVKNLEIEAFYSHILTLNVDGKPNKVIIKAVDMPSLNSYIGPKWNALIPVLYLGLFFIGIHLCHLIVHCVTPKSQNVRNPNCLLHLGTSRKYLIFFQLD